MRLKMLAIIVFGLAVLVGCSSENANDEAENPIDIKELVHDYTVGNLKAASASITSSELIVTDENQAETIYELPNDEFFVSIAPYIKDTHP